MTDKFNPEKNLGDLNKEKRLPLDYHEQAKLTEGLKKVGLNKEQIKEIFARTGIDIVSASDVAGDVLDEHGKDSPGSLTEHERKQVEELITNLIKESRLRRNKPE